jgi:hypothetical protein
MIKNGGNPPESVAENLRSQIQDLAKEITEANAVLKGLK